MQSVSSRLLRHRVSGKQSCGKCFCVAVDVHQRKTIKQFQSICGGRRIAR